MRLLNFTIIKLTVCLIIGIIIGYVANIPLGISMLSAVLLIIVLCIFYAIARSAFIKTIWFGILAFFTVISVGILTTNFHNQKNHSSHYSKVIQAESDTLKTMTFKIREVLKPGNYYDKYVIDLLDIDAKKTSGRTLLNIEKDSLQAPLKVDNIYVSRAAFKNLIHPLNPNQFDYKKYLQKKYIYHQLFISNKELLASESKSKTLFGIADAVRQHINTSLKPYHFEADELACLCNSRRYHV